MTSNTFAKYILAALIVAVAILVSIQISSRNNISELISYNEQLLRELNTSDKLRQVERDIISAESRIRGAVATNDSTFLNETDRQITEAKSYLSELKYEIGKDHTEAVYIDALLGLADQKQRLKNEVLDSFHDKGFFSPTLLKNIALARRDSNAVNKATRKITDARKVMMQQLSVSIQKNAERANRMGLMLTILALLGGIASCWFILSRAKQQQVLIKSLNESEAKVRETARVKENFMANMSHEIRTPLNAILGFTNLMKTRNPDQQMNVFVNSIEKAGENLLVIVNDILDLSKIEAGMMRIESTPFSVRGMVHSIETLFRERVKEKSLLLNTFVEDEVPDTLSGDATRLTQILVNLLSNAIKFTEQGIITVRVSSYGIKDNTIQLGFSIADTGIGIEKDKIDTIFDRFQQAEDSITRKYGGTGLGLSIVKDLVTLQQGEISVQSEMGRGTTFLFVIPYQVSAEQFTFAKTAHATLPADADVSGIRLLVVEDNELNQSLLHHLLTGWGISFDIASNGLEAVKALQAKKYSLVLMDIQMPEMDGYTATRQIRQELKLDIPIIAMTAHALAGEREKCMSYGMNEYISKPLKEQELFRLISRFERSLDSKQKETAKENNLPVMDPSGKNNLTPADRYQFINLQYIREISSGNTDYERSVTGMFLEDMPQDLQSLIEALDKGDYDLLSKLAHDLKTSTSIMGLTDKLGIYLDSLEHQPQTESSARDNVGNVRRIINSALQEASHFYASINTDGK
ncbi:ATP-binding protein [Terrimonas sp. NA20]|uniref:histidine kinase n=1 Tax=Terrimonas ginsenosidimutans TaxID=2908004 RepID=A0ABS9KPM6_9BACT|nr:ATP-binding protein [Terrimonas ginsenosidimutans]MCG2614283.1 ATP-binding protein [Terrimonas ginsenosidimutans]